METELKFLVIGLGSMGKRRIRNLQALKIVNIAGFDTRDDRRIEVSEKYGVDVYGDLKKAMDVYKPDIFVISTPPQAHMYYAELAEKNDIHCFIEASVVEPDKIKALGDRIEDSKLIIAPSCTMRYYPGPKKIKELVQSGIIGRILNINYQIGQYLPDWHPWEDIKDFYVSKRETGGAREILPFELTWITDIFGMPEPLACVKTKLTDIDADIDDIYHSLLMFPGKVLGNITIEVISRPATRFMRILGDKGQIIFDGTTKLVKVNTCDAGEWVEYSLDAGTIESGYIYPEEPYIKEMEDFIRAVSVGERKQFPNLLQEDADILHLLLKLESISKPVM